MHVAKSVYVRSATAAVKANTTLKYCDLMCRDGSVRGGGGGGGGGSIGDPCPPAPFTTN